MSNSLMPRRCQHRLLLLGLLPALVIAACAQPTIDQPTTAEVEASLDRLRPLVTRIERDDSVQQCLAGLGLDEVFERRPGGGFSGTNVGPNEIAGLEQCRAEARERWPNPPAPATSVDYAALYGLYMKAADCLRAEGFEIDPPSLDTYIDMQGNWVPYDDLPELAGEEFIKLEDKCPQDPWSYESG